jgi:hypothetical protein
MRSYATVMVETNIPSFVYAPYVITQAVPIRVSGSCRVIFHNLQLQCFETVAYARDSIGLVMSCHRGENGLSLNAYANCYKLK